MTETVGPLADALFVKASKNLTLDLTEKDCQVIVPVGALFEILGEDKENPNLLLVRHMLTGWRFIVPQEMTQPYHAGSAPGSGKPKLKLAD